MTPFEIVIIKDELNIIYHGWLTENNSEKIYLVCGFGSNWENTQKIEMHKIEEYFIAKVKILNNNIFNFCFCNEKEEWDNNYCQDYSYIIENMPLDKLETNANIEGLNCIEKIDETIDFENLYDNKHEVNSINLYEETKVEKEDFLNSYEESEDEYYNYNRNYSIYQYRVRR